MDAATLTFLLRGGHLDMAERVERGLWPHPPLKYSEVVRHLARLLTTERWFPHPWQPWVPGEAVSERGVIERKFRWLYVYRCQRHHPLDPGVLAERGFNIFFSARGAAQHYLKWELNLPGDLDGWKVVA